MLITAQALQHWINNFYGYGSWSAPFWFVGYEESGGDLPEEVAEKLIYFTQAHALALEPTLCNIREMYRQITFRIEGPRAERFANFHDHRFGPDATQHGFWKNMTAFTYGYQHKKIPDPLAYQQQHFAAPGSQEAFIQFYPLPAHSHAWYYSWLDLPQFPFLKSRMLYQKHVYPKRIADLCLQMERYKPKVVLMYGMENINTLKASIREFFPSAKFKTVKGVKNETPQYHKADLKHTKLLITTQIPGLHHNRKETGYDWEAFGSELGSEFAELEN
jgi:hypothetical protein